MQKKSEKGRPVFGLGALEARILGVVYDNCKVGAPQGDPLERISVRQVYEILLKERHIAYTTVMTVMGNLVKKELLSVDPSSIAFYYKPVIERDKLRDELVDDLVNTLYGGNRKLYLSKA